MYELSGQAEGVDWTDVAMAGRAYADNVVGEPAITASMHRMADEIERLRLTDAERFVLREVMDIYAGEDDVKSNEIAAVIDRLLERTKD
jgi:hypothetical protein